MFGLFFHMCQFFSKLTKSGTIPIYQNKVVLIESLKHQGKLVLPKGKIKKNEKNEIAALRETMEEAVLEGILRKEPKIIYNNTIYFVLDVNKIYNNYKENNERKRYFLTYNEMMIHKDVSKKVKQIFKDYLNLNIK